MSEEASEFPVDLAPVPWERWHPYASTTNNSNQMALDVWIYFHIFISDNVICIFLKFTSISFLKSEDIHSTVHADWQHHTHSHWVGMWRCTNYKPVQDSVRHMIQYNNAPITLLISETEVPVFQVQRWHFYDEKGVIVNWEILASMEVTRVIRECLKVTTSIWHMWTSIQKMQHMYLWL